MGSIGPITEIDVKKTSGSLEELINLLPKEDVVLPSSPLYSTHTKTWSLAKDRRPRLVIVPSTVELLAKVIAYLANTDLHFKVRGQGFGSSSADDVLVSLAAFDDFEFHQENEEQGIAYVGSGQSWGEYYRKMEEAKPGWTVVGARTPAIGVGGSTLCGGFSWLSGEYGCISDTENMLDVQIVKIDGTIMWASEDPTLLWAVRGTQGAFGIATKFKFRARKYTESIWAGGILLPRSAMEEVIKGTVAMDKPETSLKIAMFMYIMQKDKLQFVGAEEDMIVIHVVDGEGEAHGRSAEGFKWALDIPGAVDNTRVTNIRGVAAMQEHINNLKGTGRGWWFPMALPNLTEDIMRNAFQWHADVSAQPGSIGENAYLLFELFSCNRRMGSKPTESNSESGWPRPGYFRHTILLGAGSGAEGTPTEDAKAQKLLQAGPRKIIGPDARLDITPNGMEKFHDLNLVFSTHLPRLRELKAHYDPYNKLNSLITPA